MTMRVVRGQVPIRAGIRALSVPASVVGRSRTAPSSISATMIEPVVERRARELLDARPKARPSRTTTLERAAEQANADLVAYRDSDRVLAAIGPDRFTDGLAARADRLERPLLRVSGRPVSRTRTRSRGGN